MANPSDVITPATTDFFVKGAMQNSIEYSIVFRKLQQSGNLRTITGGLNYTWVVDGGLTGVTDTTDGADLTDFLSIDQVDVQATLPWADKVARAIMTNGMRRVNAGDPALDSYKKKIVPKAMRSLLHQGASSAKYDLLNSDGTGTGQKFFGLPAVFQFGTGVTTQEATVSSGATYAGKSLEADGLASEITNPTDSYIWTPRGVNTAYTGWTNGGGWTVDDALEILAYAQQQVTFDPDDPDQRPDTVLLDKASYLILRSAIEAKQNIYIQVPGKPDSGAGNWAIGTSPDMLYYSGLDVCWDGAAPANKIRVLNFNQIAMICQAGMEDVNTTGLQVMKGESMGVSLEFMTDAIFNSRSIGTLITLPGQWQLNPRFCAEIADYS